MVKLSILLLIASAILSQSARASSAKAPNACQVYGLSAVFSLDSRAQEVADSQSSVFHDLHYMNTRQNVEASDGPDSKTHKNAPSESYNEGYKNGVELVTFMVGDPNQPNNCTIDIYAERHMDNIMGNAPVSVFKESGTCYQVQDHMALRLMQMPTCEENQSVEDFMNSKFMKSNPK